MDELRQQAAAAQAAQQHTADAAGIEIHQLRQSLSHKDEGATVEFDELRDRPVALGTDLLATDLLGIRNTGHHEGGNDRHQHDHSTHGGTPASFQGDGTVPFRGSGPAEVTIDAGSL
jgi:hypothetical protein